MLERRSGSGEFDRLLVAVVGQQAIEQTAHERVAAADAVHDVRDVVATGLPERLAVEEDTTPGVVVRIDGAAERDRHLLAARETLHQLPADTLETRLVDLAARLLRIKTFRFDAEFLLGVFFIAQDQVAAFHQGGHHLRRRLPIFPEFLAVVQVAGNLDTQLIGHFDRFQAGIGGTLAQGRRDARPMEPVGAFQHLAPVHHARLDLGDGRIGPVIDHFAAACHGTGLQIVDTDTVAAIHHAVEVHPQPAELGQTHVGNIVLGHARDEMRVHTVIGQGNGHVGLTAAEGGVELARLGETQETRGRKAKHHFAESNNFCHIE